MNRKIILFLLYFNVKKIIEIKINAEIKTLKSDKELTASTSRNKVKFIGTISK